MNRGRTPAEVDEGRREDAPASDRAFRLALWAYASVEFVAVALFVYYKLSR